MLLVGEMARGGRLEPPIPLKSRESRSQQTPVTGLQKTWIWSLLRLAT
jgi:hypothetical protein